MTRSQSDGKFDFCQVMVESYAVNERMNQVLLEHLDPAAWRAQLPGSKGRTIAAIVAHVHNIRRKWLRLSAPHLKLPAPLDRARCTQEQAKAALAGKRRALLRDACGSSVRAAEPSENLSPGRLGQTMAGRRLPCWPT